MVKKNIKPLNFEIDSRSKMPVYEQVKQEIKLLIISGYLEPEDQLVPIRELAGNLKINANTIVKVYYQLDVEGFVYSQPGSGYFVRTERKVNRDEKIELFEQICEDYISKALKLGFSLDDMIATLSRRSEETKTAKKGRSRKKKDAN
ncbi:MAG: GntR family transcriptional regulator [bacterium]|nr:GntR family transcriptional regulator [bacterium]